MAYDDDYRFGFRDYVSVAERRAQAAYELLKLRKSGRQLSPVVVDGRKIAKTFWGEAWCDNLERYSDYSNRLPRGRSYVRYGSVLDLQLGRGDVTALVRGSALYDVRVSVASVPRARWQAICRDCAGAIDSLVELLQGRLSDAVTTRLCQETTGLFPSPREIRFTCSCPDWASMCKHVAAVLYGIGARLDREPGLLFTLRQLEVQDLINNAGTHLTAPKPKPSGSGTARVLEVPGDSSLSEMFGIDIADTAIAPQPAGRRRPKEPGRSSRKRPPAAAAGRGLSDGTTSARSLKAPQTPAPREPGAPLPDGRLLRRKHLPPRMREAVSARVRAYWAERRRRALEERIAAQFPKAKKRPPKK